MNKICLITPNFLFCIFSQELRSVSAGAACLWLCNWEECFFPFFFHTFNPIPSYNKVLSHQHIVDLEILLYRSKRVIERMHTHTHAHMMWHAHTHARAHTHTHTRTHTCMHVHICKRLSCEVRGSESMAFVWMWRYCVFQFYPPFFSTHNRLEVESFKEVHKTVNNTQVIFPSKAFYLNETVSHFVPFFCVCLLKTKLMKYWSEYWPILIAAFRIVAVTGCDVLDLSNFSP